MHTQESCDNPKVSTSKQRNGLQYQRGIISRSSPYSNTCLRRYHRRLRLYQDTSRPGIDPSQEHRPPKQGFLVANNLAKNSPKLQIPPVTLGCAQNIVDLFIGVLRTRSRNDTIDFGTKLCHFKVEAYYFADTFLVIFQPPSSCFV